MGLSGCWRSLPSAVHLSRSHPALDKDMHVRTTTDSEQTSLCSTPSRRLAYDVTPKAYPSIPLGCGRPLASFERKVLLLKANLRRKFQLLPVRYYAVYDSSSAYQVRLMGENFMLVARLNPRCRYRLLPIPRPLASMQP